MVEGKQSALRKVLITEENKSCLIEVKAKDKYAQLLFEISPNIPDSRSFCA